jgi:hypothetical protein
MNEGFPQEWQRGKLADFCDINLPLSERKWLNDETEVSFLKMEDVSNSARVTNKRLRTYEEVSKGFTAFKDKDAAIPALTH